MYMISMADVIFEIVPEIIVRIFYLAAAAASMVAIDSNEQVKEEYKHTYNYLIFILVIVIIQIISFIASGVLQVTGGGLL